MTSRFAEYLRAKLDEKDMSPAELSRRSGTTKQNIGRILNDTRHYESNAPPTVTKETAEKLAKGLGLPVDEVLLEAGYAPRNIDAPKTPAELLEALQRIGIDVSHVEPFNLVNGDYEALLRDIQLVVELRSRK